MELIGGMQNIGDLANMYGFAQRQLSIRNQLEQTLELQRQTHQMQEQTRYAREQRDFHQHAFEVLRQRSEDSDEKLRQTITARKLLARLKAQLGKISLEYDLENVFGLAVIFRTGVELAEADVFEELQDIQEIENLHQEAASAAKTFQQNHKLEGDPLKWADFLINEMENGLIRARDVLLGYCFFDPERQAAIIDDIEARDNRICEMYAAAKMWSEHYQKLCEFSDGITDEIPEKLSEEEGLLGINWDCEHALSRAEELLTEVEMFSEESASELRKKYDVPNELSQTASIRRNLFELLELSDISVAAQRVKNLHTEFEQAVQWARETVPDWLVSRERFPECGMSYIDMMGDKRYPSSSLCNVLLSLINKSFVYTSHLAVIKRIQAFCLKTQIFEKLFVIQTAVERGDYILAEREIGEFEREFRRIVDFVKVKNTVAKGLDILKDARNLEERAAEAYGSVLGFLGRSKRLDEVRRGAEGLRKRLGEIPRGDLAVEVERCLDGIEMNL